VPRLFSLLAVGDSSHAVGDVSVLCSLSTSHLADSITGGLAESDPGVLGEDKDWDNAEELLVDSCDLATGARNVSLDLVLLLLCRESVDFYKKENKPS
jgi:hypothetical protein